MIATLIAVLRAKAYTVQYNGLIEVCSNGIAYVPLDTKFVKCNGIVRQVRKFTKTITEGEDPCKCPDCCDGWCYVIVNSDPTENTALESKEAEQSKNGVQHESESQDTYILWLAC